MYVWIRTYVLPGVQIKVKIAKLNREMLLLFSMQNARDDIFSSVIPVLCHIYVSNCQSLKQIRYVYLPRVLKVGINTTMIIVSVQKFF